MTTVSSPTSCFLSSDRSPAAGRGSADSEGPGSGRPRRGEMSVSLPVCIPQPHQSSPLLLRLSGAILCRAVLAVTLQRFSLCAAVLLSGLLFSLCAAILRCGLLFSLRGAVLFQSSLLCLDSNIHHGRRPAVPHIGRFCQRCDESGPATEPVTNTIPIPAYTLTVPSFHLSVTSVNSSEKVDHRTSLLGESHRSFVPDRPGSLPDRSMTQWAVGRLHH